MAVLFSLYLHLEVLLWNSVDTQSRPFVELCSGADLCQEVTTLLMWKEHGIPGRMNPTTDSVPTVTAGNRLTNICPNWHHICLYVV